MRTIQQTFDVVISHGIYNPYLRQHYFECDIPDTSEGYRRDYYMCNALTFAWKAGVITAQEEVNAHIAVAHYLWQAREIANCAPGTMYTAFESCRLRNDPIDLIRLYRDWENRPPLNLIHRQP